MEWVMKGLAIVFIIFGLISIVPMPKSGKQVEKLKKTLEEKGETLEANEKKSKKAGIICIVLAALLYGGGVLLEGNVFTDIGMSDAQASVAEQAFVEARLGEPSSISKAENVEHQYWVTTDKYSDILLIQNDDKSLSDLVYNKKILWNNGSLNSGIKIEDIYVTTEQFVTYKTLAEAAVEKQLNFPDGADFEMSPKVYRHLDEARVVGDFKAPNAFGVMIRCRYYVDIKGDKVINAVVKER